MSALGSSCVLRFTCTASGAIIFACHKINSYPRNGVVGASGMPHLGYHQNGYAPPGNAQYYDPHPQNLPQNPHVSSLHSYNYSPHPQPPMSSSYPPNAWVNMDASGSSSQYTQWTPGSYPNSAPVSSMRSSSYAAPPPPAPQQHWPSQPPSYIDSDSPVSPAGPPVPSPTIAQYPTPSRIEEEAPPPSPPSDLVPAPRSGRRNNREQYSSGGRTTGNPPAGITRCASCKATHSPEWRKGPSGKKDLCNA